jgi:hypothetical protein
MSFRTEEPRYQATPMSSSSRRYLTGGFVRSLPEEIRGCPKHATTFFAVFVALKRTTPTQTFLSQLIVPTNLNIQRYIRACNPLRIGSQDFSAFMSPTSARSPGDSVSFLGYVTNSPPCGV